MDSRAESVFGLYIKRSPVCGQEGVRLPVGEAVLDEVQPTHLCASFLQLRWSVVVAVGSCWSVIFSTRNAVIPSPGRSPPRSRLPKEVSNRGAAATSSAVKVMKPFIPTDTDAKRR